jgi:hypothetical protein
LYSDYFVKEGLEGVGGFKIGGQILRTVKYVDDFVILAEEQTVLLGMIVRLA